MGSCTGCCAVSTVGSQGLLEKGSGKIVLGSMHEGCVLMICGK